ncbi:MAG: uroporphyrinogen-III C-methyltransferase [Macromonas sp.]
MASSVSEPSAVLPPVDAASAASPPAAAPVASSARRTGTVVAWLALGAAAGALAVSVSLWNKLDQAQQELARRSTDTLAQASAARAVAAQAQALTQDMQARLGVAEVKLSEVTLQRSQLEELMQSLSRSRDDSLVQDLESTLQLAQQQSQLTGSIQPLISALQAADQRIARSAQPRLNPVQKAIVRDIERLQTAALVDLPVLAERIDALVRQIDELPLINGLAAAQVDVAPAAATPATGPAKPASVYASSTSETDAASVLSQWWAQYSQVALVWAQPWLDAVQQRTGQLVRVSRIDHPEAVLLAPEQSFFLRENLKLKLLNTRLALLSRQTQAVRADLQAIDALLQRYFDLHAKPTVQARAALARLQQDLKQATQPRPDETLGALSAVITSR